VWCVCVCVCVCVCLRACGCGCGWTIRIHCHTTPLVSASGPDQPCRFTGSARNGWRWYLWLQVCWNLIALAVRHGSPMWLDVMLARSPPAGSAMGHACVYQVSPAGTRTARAHVSIFVDWNWKTHSCLVDARLAVSGTQPTCGRIMQRPCERSSGTRMCSTRSANTAQWERRVTYVWQQGQWSRDWLAVVLARWCRGGHSVGVTSCNT
jgi:hypothetical protein